MKVENRHRFVVGLLTAAIMFGAVIAGCGSHDDVPIAQQTPPPAPANRDPKVTEFLASLEKMPMADRQAFAMKSPIARQIMSGTDFAARQQFLRLVGH